MDYFNLLAAPGTLAGFIDRIIAVINFGIPLFFSVGLAIFLWGLTRMILYADSDLERARGRQIMIWGIIALFVMVSVWGLVAIVRRTFLG